MPTRRVTLCLDDVEFIADVLVEPFRPAVLYGDFPEPAEGGMIVENLRVIVFDYTNGGGQELELLPTQYPAVCEQILLEAETAIREEREAYEEDYR